MEIGSALGALLIFYLRLVSPCKKVIKYRDFMNFDVLICYNEIDYECYEVSFSLSHF